MQSSASFTHALFEAVQLNRVFPDGKTFVDCHPLQPESQILELYLAEKNNPGFDLRAFVVKHYELPVPHSVHYTPDPNASVTENIETLWTVLTREPDQENHSLIPLPYPYIVPGGRFGEIYYWDSYFTMLGLKVSGRVEMIEYMVKNFSSLINQFGYIPNGNRHYFLGRSQPPFFSLMVKLLASVKGNAVLADYLPQLEKEYWFWMKRTGTLSVESPAEHHLVLLPDGELMNRYWDEQDTARPEAWREDVELSHQSDREPAFLFRQLRAGAESGWDYSCRWFRQPDSFATIHTTEIIPVDLNCLLFHLEETIANACEKAGHAGNALQWKALAEKRKQAILKYCWNEAAGFFTDFDFISGRHKDMPTLAGLFPLFAGIATKEQAASTAAIVKEKFLFPGGLVSTPVQSGQQWDAPNGWAPLQWISIIGLEQYGFSELAADVADRWIRLNTAVYKRTGKMMEKYNVVDTHLEAGGGEYEGQDGFGWTNGVLLDLVSRYGNRAE